MRIRSGLSSAAAFAAIENLNSDNDPGGATNIAEIRANTQPGWTVGANNTTYIRSSLLVSATNQTAPVTGALDPAAAPVNHAPVLAAIGPRTVNENQTLAFTATATDSDGNALTFTGGSLPTGATLSSGGAFSWTPTFAQAGNYNVTITVTDNGSPVLSDFETFTITVGNVNRPPVLAAIGPKTVNENQNLAFTATASDPDVPSTLTFSASGMPTGATLSSAGAFSWTPTFSQSGNYNVTITVSDNAVPPATDFELFTITVGDVNRPPVLAPIGSKSVNVGQTLAFTATATDPDGNAVTFAGSSLPSGATLTSAGAFSWTPTSAQAGNFSVTITATDNGSPAQNDSETFNIAVGAVNRPPVLNPIGAKTVNEGQLLSFTATASDPDGGTLSFTGSNLPSGATLSLGGAFSWTPNFSQAGNYNVTITVSDGALTDSETFTISVGNVNRPPVLSPSPVGSRTVTVGQTLTISFTASDPDGDALSFTSANLPAGATLVPSGNSAVLSFTPAAAATYSNVTVTVSDGALTDAEIFTITVNAVSVNGMPVLTNPGPKTVTVGQTLAFTLTATDPDGNALNFASANLPSGATLSPSGAFSWTPTATQVGNHSVTVTVTDNGTPALTSAAQTFLITVLAAVPTSDSVQITEAEWDHGRLEVEGKVSPALETVMIFDAASGKPLGSIQSGGDGDWKLVLEVRPAPCSVQAKTGGASSAVTVVRGTPGRCNAKPGKESQNKEHEEDDDHEEHDDH